MSLDKKHQEFKSTSPGGESNLMDRGPIYITHCMVVYTGEIQQFNNVREIQLEPK